jgi:hypothetical protein
VFAETGLTGAEGELLPVSATALGEIPGLEELDGLSFCIRVNLNTSEKDLAYYDYCMELLREIAA